MGMIKCELKNDICEWVDSAKFLTTGDWAVVIPAKEIAKVLRGEDCSYTLKVCLARNKHWEVRVAGYKTWREGEELQQDVLKSQLPVEAFGIFEGR